MRDEMDKNNSFRLKIEYLTRYFQTVAGLFTAVSAFLVALFGLWTLISPARIDCNHGYKNLSIKEQEKCDLELEP